MEVEATKTEYVRVHINRRATLEKIMGDMMRYICPPELAKYDDWLIDKNGKLVGITEYHHGSDSSTTLGMASLTTREVYDAIQTIRRNLDVLPSED